MGMFATLELGELKTERHRSQAWGGVVGRWSLSRQRGAKLTKESVAVLVGCNIGDVMCSTEPVSAIQWVPDGHDPTTSCQRRCTASIGVFDGDDVAFEAEPASGQQIGLGLGFGLPDVVC